MEDYPVHDTINVHEGETVYKTAQWWKAIILYEGHNGTKIGIYLWQRTEGEWRRRQKFVVRSRDDWKRDTEHINTLLPKLELHDDERPAGTSKSPDIYHLLADDKTKSKCGTLNNKFPSPGNIEEVLTSTEAKERGLSLCNQCANITSESEPT